MKLVREGQCDKQQNESSESAGTAPGAAAPSRSRRNRGEFTPPREAPGEVAVLVLGFFRDGAKERSRIICLEARTENGSH